MEDALRCCLVYRYYNNYGWCDQCPRCGRVRDFAQPAAQWHCGLLLCAGKPAGSWQCGYQREAGGLVVVALTSREGGGAFSACLSPLPAVCFVVSTAVSLSGISFIHPIGGRCLLLWLQLWPRSQCGADEIHCHGHFWCLPLHVPWAGSPEPGSECVSQGIFAVLLSAYRGVPESRVLLW